MLQLAHTAPGAQVPEPDLAAKVRGGEHVGVAELMRVDVVGVPLEQMLELGTA
jgi:hypothetical protein